MTDERANADETTNPSTADGPSTTESPSTTEGPSSTESPDNTTSGSDDPHEAMRLPDGGSTRCDGESTEEVEQGYPEGMEMDIASVADDESEPSDGADDSAPGTSTPDDSEAGTSPDAADGDPSES